MRLVRRALDDRVSPTTNFWQAAGWMLVLAVGMSVFWAAHAGPAWATPNSSPLRQTIPTLVPTPLPSWIWIGLPDRNPADYAPSGMPDFDQHQADWHDPAQTDRWTHSAPVAATDGLWWLDSRPDPGSAPPPAVTDGCGLVSPYGAWDDHDPRNVGPLVNDLARRMDTDGIRTSSPHSGTQPESMLAALQDYLTTAGLDNAYTIGIVRSPSYEQMLDWVRHRDAVVLYLGFWEDQGTRWINFGGHFVALAGLEPANQLAAISDPFQDAFEAGATRLGRSPAAHPYPHAVEFHNDARYASHDGYAVLASARPMGALALVDYGLNVGRGGPFLGQNLSPELQPQPEEWGGGVAEAELNYAIVISSRLRSLYLPIILRRAR